MNSNVGYPDTTALEILRTIRSFFPDKEQALQAAHCALSISRQMKGEGKPPTIEACDVEDIKALKEKRKRQIENFYILVTNGQYVTSRNDSKLNGKWLDVGMSASRRFHDVAERFHLPMDDWGNPISLVRFREPHTRIVRYCLRWAAEQCGYIEGVTPRDYGRAKRTAK